MSMYFSVNMHYSTTLLRVCVHTNQVNCPSIDNRMRRDHNLWPD